jgi:hypothetical protein
VAHDKHALIEVLPVDGLYVPAAQDEHKDWPGDEYVPAAQDKHEDWPEDGLYIGESVALGDPRN